MRQRRCRLVSLFSCLRHARSSLVCCDHLCVLLFPCTSVVACSTHGYHAPSLPFQNVTSLVWPIEAVICCDVCCPRRSVVDHCDSFAVCFVVSCSCTPPCGSFVPRSSERVSPKGVWPAHRFVCSRRGSHYVS